MTVPVVVPVSKYGIEKEENDKSNSAINSPGN